jgi:hypothetical protein
MFDFFVSYKTSVHVKYAAALTHKLEDLNYEVFFDRKYTKPDQIEVVDGEIIFKTPEIKEELLSRGLKEAVISSNSMLFFLYVEQSPEEIVSKPSYWQKYEASFAKKILLLLPEHKGVVYFDDKPKAKAYTSEGQLISIIEDWYNGGGGSGTPLTIRVQAVAASIRSY